MNSKDLKLAVQEKYGEIARAADGSDLQSCGCGTSCCSGSDYSSFNDNYDHLEGYNPDADLGLGCGIPTDFAGLKPGDHVLDLGSGAGNDCFVARAIVGETGYVTGLDFTGPMLIKAEENRKKLGYSNIDFVQGDIEEMPLDDNTFDVTLSNCVLNLVPDKIKAFSEIMRVLKPGGHFCVSDVVLKGDLPEQMRSDAELYVGCVSGAVEMNEYIQIIERQGFKDIVIHKEKQITLPETLLAGFTDDSEIMDYKTGIKGVFSITVTGYKR
jgi:SAM-dependent methyltransferase